LYRDVTAQAVTKRGEVFDFASKDAGFSRLANGSLHASGNAGDSSLDGTDAERRGVPVEGRSSNHFELAYTKFEFLLDFGQAYDTSDQTLLHTRIIMTPSSAKTLSHMLEHLIQQYEAEIGAIEERTV
jgi:hypothetical protein